MILDLEKIKKIYFVGIGGIAMSAVAAIAKKKGFEVIGSDSKEVYSPAKDVLEKSQIAFFKGCDFLIHEAQYTPIEYQSKVGWGHSSVSNAAILIKHAEISEWIITHHDPKHTDMDLLNKIQMQFDILDDCAMEVRPRMAFDQLTIPL